MADCIEVSIAKALVAAIETARDADELEFDVFEVDWDFGQRFELQQHRTQGLPEDWLLTDDKLQVRVIVPEKPLRIKRYFRQGLSWETSVDIDIRRKMGIASNDADGAIDRDELSKLCHFVEQIFETTGFDLSDDGIDCGDDRFADWMDGGNSEVSGGSEILLKYSQLFLRQRQFFGIARQVFLVA